MEGQADTTNYHVLPELHPLHHECLAVLTDQQNADVDDQPSNVTANHTTLYDLPPLTANDCVDDVEFANMYNYLQAQILTNNDKIDKWTVLLSDQFWLDVNSGLMYKISIPKDKKTPSCQA